MSTNGHIAVPPILLTIAGFDPSCGAGTAADLKTFAAYGCYGVAAITSLTVQNTQGVEAVHNMSSAELREQLDVPEAEVLTGLEIKDIAGMEAAARKLVEMGARAVIVKGGHMERAVDVVFDGNELVQLGGDKVKVENTHGTGCTFASALTAQLAAGRSLIEAATLAKAYVTKAIEKGYAIGKGRMPLDHFYRLKIEPLARGTHEVPQHGMHPAAEPTAH